MSCEKHFSGLLKCFKNNFKAKLFKSYLRFVKIPKFSNVFEAQITKSGEKPRIFLNIDRIFYFIVLIKVINYFVHTYPLPVQHWRSYGG